MRPGVSGGEQGEEEAEEEEGVKEAGDDRSLSVAAVEQEMEGMEQAWAEKPM